MHMQTEYSGVIFSRARYTPSVAQQDLEVALTNDSRADRAFIKTALYGIAVEA